MKKIALAIAVIVLALIGTIIFKSFTGKVVNEDTKEFTIKAFRFGYSPDVLTVNKGDKVKTGQLIAESGGFVSTNIHSSGQSFFITPFSIFMLGR